MGFDTSELRTLLAVTTTDMLAGLREGALLLLGFAGHYRRSHLVALDVEDVTETENRLRMRIRRSKTVQEGEGREVGIPWEQKPDTNPVWELRALCSTASIATGSLLRPINRHNTVQDRRLMAEGVAWRRGTHRPRPHALCQPFPAPRADDGCCSRRGIAVS